MKVILSWPYFQGCVFFCMFFSRKSFLKYKRKLQPILNWEIRTFGWIVFTFVYYKSHEMWTSCRLWHLITFRCRTRFMLETITALRNNNIRKIPNYDPSQTDRARKILKKIIHDTGKTIPFGFIYSFFHRHSSFPWINLVCFM